MSLTIEQLRALDALVQTGLDLPVATRRAWFDALATESPALKTLLQRALFAERSVESGTFMGTVPKIERATREAIDLSAGDIVGPYCLDALVGEGGSAGVWRAVRVDGTMKRAVALKLPYFVGNTRGWAERIERERDVLASLNHPNVATIYDAGIADNGRPWLALELINGERIDQYARAKKITGDALVRLFLPAVRAIEHAHARGVIHRDVKPHNILVAENDRHEAQLKLLDFGIAKLQNDFADDQDGDSELTRIHGRPFTPEYASLEQLRGETITTATDIYALGVVFYELLCGNRPFDTSGDAGSLRKLEQRIATDAPIAPSQRSADKRLSSHALAIPSDLDAIALKALHRDNDKRYQTASAFAEDLERCLRRETISAQADSGVYRAKQFVKRNRLWVGASAGVAVSLFAGLGAALWQAQEARAQRTVAEAQAQRATSALADAEQQRVVASDAADRADTSAARAREAANKSETEAKRAETETLRAKAQTALAERSKLEAKNEAARASLQQVRADSEAQSARVQQRTTEEVKKFLVGALTAANVNQVDAEKKRKQTLEELVKSSIERIKKTPPRDPQIFEDLLVTLGEIQEGIGLTTSAIELNELALQSKIKRAAPKHEIIWVKAVIAGHYAGTGKREESIKTFQALVDEIGAAKTIDEKLVLAKLEARKAMNQAMVFDFAKSAQSIVKADVLFKELDVESQDSNAVLFARAWMEYHRDGNAKKAAETFQEIVRISDKIDGKTSTWAAHYRMILASFLIAARQPTLANEAATQAIAVLDATSGRGTYQAARVLSTLGATYYFIGEHDLAIRHSLESEALYTSFGIAQVGPTDFAALRMFTALAYLAKGESQLAKRYGDLAVMSFEKLSSEELLKQSGSVPLRVAGIVSTYVGDYAQGIRRLDTALRSVEPKLIGGIDVVNEYRAELAWSHYLAGNRQDALTILANIKDYENKMGTSGSASYLRAALLAARIDSDNGDTSAFQRANEVLRAVRENTEIDGVRKKVLRAELDRQIGVIQLQSNKNAEALQTLILVVQTTERTETTTSPRLASDRALLATALARSGKLAEAKALYRALVGEAQNLEPTFAPHFLVPIKQFESEFAHALK
jgi:serine/threonine protein kinase